MALKVAGMAHKSRQLDVHQLPECVLSVSFQPCEDLPQQSISKNNFGINKAEKVL